VIAHILINSELEISTLAAEVEGERFMHPYSNARRHRIPVLA